MFFTEYDPMTKERVDAAVIAKERADNGAVSLEGLQFSARLEGEFAPEELRYDFVNGKEVRVTENGQTYTARCEAVSHAGLYLVTHLVPGTSRAFHLILDPETWALTVFETWFGITVPVGIDMTGQSEPQGWRDIPREVQREYYFGWADTGSNEKPEHFHEPTNRIEGRGLHWAYDNEFKMLSFFPSVMCCTVVELGKEMGGITMSNPADYIKIDDRRYLFARWEVEFSGKMWIEIMDFFRMNAAGLELGFEADSSLTYRFHSAALTVTGDCAHLENISDTGRERPALFRGMPKKGGRYAYRPMDIDLPMKKEEAYYHAARAQRILQDPGDTENIMQSFNCLPLTEKLAGKHFRVVQDNEKYKAAPWSGTGREETAWEYEILEKKMIRWRKGEGPWHEEKYGCFEVDEDLYFIGHLETGAEDFAMVAQAVDFRTGLTTTVRTGIGNWRSEWECGPQVFFGTLDAPGVTPPFTRRHEFTDELVGLCFAWNYAENMNSIHLYSAPESYSWTIFKRDNGGGATWSSPGFYIKLRPGVYMINWTEERCNGSQGLLIINRKIQHDSGFFYGVNHAGLRLELAGAFMRELGYYDIRKYFYED